MRGSASENVRQAQRTEGEADRPWPQEAPPHRLTPVKHDHRPAQIRAHSAGASDMRNDAKNATYKRTGMLYLDVLPDELLPAGAYLVHNHVRPQKPLGMNGFRAWMQHSSDKLVECRCHFGGCKNSKVHEVHYRVDRGALSA
jgi:hypothetical protein